MKRIKYARLTGAMRVERREDLEKARAKADRGSLDHSGSSYHCGGCLN